MMDHFIDSLPFLAESVTRKLHTVEWEYGILCAVYTAGLILVLYYFLGSTDGYFPPQRYHTPDLSRAELLAKEVVSELTALIPEKPAKVSKHVRKEVAEDPQAEVPVSRYFRQPVFVEETFLRGQVPDDW